MSSRSIAATFLLAATALAQAAVMKAPHSEVTYEGADAKWAKAMAETMSIARTIYLEEFACDMPDTVYGQLTVKPGENTRLYTDGRDHLFLSVPSESKLAKPSKSGVFNLYGLCHELGHMAMYRVLRERDWMTGDAAEGWAHYAGSVVTDRVFAAKGEALWPDAYDYRADGTARLKKQLASPSPEGVTAAAGEWQKLGTIIGQKGFAKLFVAWQAADIDASKPAESLLAVAAKVFPDKKDDLTRFWAAGAAERFVKVVQASDLKATTIAISKLTGKPVAIASDDGQSEGKKSIAGGGHARKFIAPDDGEWYIRSVSVFGAQYGRARNATFDLAICDADMKTVTTWKKSYSAFKLGDMAWARLPVTPTRIPEEFYICLNFRPTASQGVYVGFDESTKGNSLVGIPGESGRDFTQGDWMIRIELDKPKEAVSQPAN